VNRGAVAPGVRIPWGFFGMASQHSRARRVRQQKDRIKRRQKVREYRKRLPAEQGPAPTGAGNAPE
jgi:hypothetical protein